MFKKITLGMLTALLALSMTACAGVAAENLSTLTLPGEETGSSTASSLGAPAEVEEMKDTEAPDNLEGLCKFLEGNHAVAGDKTQMSYEVIGAVDGYKYRFKYNAKTVQVEVYEYDLKNLNDTAKTALNEMKESGSFTVLDRQVGAVISENGKYVMVYSDESNEEKNNAQKERVLELFQGFKSGNAA